MTMPGFTAEASLYQSGSTFITPGDLGGSDESAELQYCSPWKYKRCKWVIRDCRRSCWGDQFCFRRCIGQSGCADCYY